jgi:type IV secretory pathway VirB2 component (pilin)
MGKDLISREALERIIKRAAELQAGEHDVGDGLTNTEVLALGKDVGIPDRYLRQAMLEEQTRITPEVATGTWAWLTGPRSIIAHRVVPGDRAAVERTLSRWMTEEALLQPKRHYPDRTSWEPKAGAFASIQRALAGKRRYSLAQAEEITAQVVQLEAGFCLVRLEADIRQQRTKRISGATVLAVVGWAVTGATALIAPPLALAQALLLVPGVGLTIGGAAVARTYRGANERMQIALEQVLDRLERGDIRSASSQEALPGVQAFTRIAEEVRKVFENPRPKPRG